MRAQPYLGHVWTDYFRTWAQRQHMIVLHMRIILFRGQKWPTGDHFSNKKKKHCRIRAQPFLGHAFTDVVQTWQTNNE